jgi:hypothetical protein
VPIGCCLNRVGLMQPAHGIDELVQPERFGQECNASRERVGWSPGYHQAAPGRGGIFRPQRFHQVGAPLRAEVGVEDHHVVPAWAHRARLCERGRDIHFVPAGAECTVDQDPYVLEIIDNENP